MADEVASLLVRITADGSQAIGVLNGVSSTVTTLASKNASLMNKISATGQLAGSAGRVMTKTFGVATVAGLVASAKAAGQLNKELANIGTLSVPTERLKEFKGDIQDIAIATAKSTSDISEGTYQVISAFGDAPDTMEKVEINAKAATAGLATTADSIALTSAVTKAYGDTSAAATQHVADLAFKTVELGQTTFPELAQNMQQVTSLSKELGVSQEELFGAYATLTGVTGNAAEVQTQMKAVYTALLKPSENMEAAISKLGYSSGFSMIKTLGFAGTLKALKSATNGSEEQMLGLFNNVRAMPAVMALTGAQADVFSEKLEKMKNASGAATKAFEVQTEGVAKTGFTLEQAKVKMQVAAQNFGESAAPMIADFADIVDKASTNLASLSDEERQAIINTGVLTTKIGLGLAVGGKALTMGVNTVNTVGKIKKAASAGGALAKFAPMLTGIASAAGPVALGVAGITTAVVVGKSAYDAWYNSNYKFADGLSNTAKEISSYKDKCQELNDLQWEHKDLSFKIDSGKLNDEELENAKNRLKEIEQILKEKYSIDIDTENLDEAIEKAKELEKLEFLNKKKGLRDDIENLAPKYEKASSGLPQLEADYNNAKAAAQSYTNTLTNVADWQEQYDKGIIDAETYTSKFTEALNDLGRECGKGDKYGKKLLDEFSGAITGGLENPGFLSSWLQNQLYNFENELNVEGLKKKLDDAKATIEEYKEALQTLTAIDLSELKNDLNDGVINDTAATAEIDSIIERLSTLDNGLKQLRDNEKIDVKFNLDTGGVEISDLNGTELGEITAEGKINWKTGELPEIKDQDGKVIYYGDYSNLKAPTLRGTITYETAGFSASNVPWAKKAKGDMNFPGGLAMVNDQTGIADNRELIIDRGRAFIPEGRNVVLPLSKGAKVYTAAQTKAIMSGLGIPHYAAGKDNSDAFTNARDDWSHYTKTHSVTTAQELQKWLEFQRQYKKNEKDIWDIEEQVFSLQQKLYSERVKESEKWLAHEEKYNGMGVDDYLAGIDRMKAYTAEYYAQGIINHKEYTDALAELDEKYIDKRKEQLSQMFDASSAYISEHTYFNDWENDDPLSAYNRVMDRHREALANGELTQAEYDEYAKNLGSDMYSERRDQSGNWLDEQEKYFGMEADAYIAGLEREKAYTEEYYRKGLIDRRAYNEGMTELNHAIWDKASESYDDMLSKQSDYISDMRDKFQKEEQSLRDSWTVEDRAADIAKVSAQLDIYAGAVTDRGQQKYAELQEQMKQLQRDEELYQLEVRNNAVIEGLEADYEAAEAAKSDFLKSIVANTDIDVSGIVGSLTSQVASYGNNIETLLSTLISKFDGFKVENNSMTDNRKFSYNISQMTPEQIQDMLKQIVGR